jgi:GNAT superfamily N-acetyltransferase
MSKKREHSAQIRESTPEEAAEIADLLRRSFAEYESSYTPAAFAATISTPDQIAVRMKEGPIWVALSEGEIVGTVSAVLKGEALYIRGMAVDPLARGGGIGKGLLKRVEEFAIGRGLRRLFLSTTPFLLRAIALYERHGFRRNDEGPHDLRGTPLFTMVKNLGD